MSRLWIAPLMSTVGWLLQLPLLLEGFTVMSVALLSFATLMLGLTCGVSLSTCTSARPSRIRWRTFTCRDCRRVK